MPPKAIEPETPKQYEFDPLHSSKAEWFSIAVFSTAMKKDILLRVLPSGLSLRVEDCASSGTGGDILLTHLPA